jgi:hypothetical protein
LYIIFRLFARLEVKKKLILIQCRQCGAYFCICRKCWKGQAYCGDTCKQLGYAQRRKEAQRRYRKTENGKGKHREAEQRRRLRLQPDNRKTDDETEGKKQNQRDSNPAFHALHNGATIRHTTRPGKERTKKGRCHFCGVKGVIVKRISQDKGPNASYIYYSFRVNKEG